MKTWAAFLDSLGTRGGNILILLAATGGLFLAALHIMHHTDKSEVATVVLSTFSGFSGALLNALVSGGKSAVQLNLDNVSSDKKSEVANKEVL